MFALDRLNAASRADDGWGPMALGRSEGFTSTPHPPRSHMQIETILIVEDEPHIAAVVALKLEQAGHATATCESLGEAKRLLRARAFGLVIADVHLRGECGIDIADWLPSSGRNATTPVLLLTGSARGVATETLPHLVRGVLTKPFSPSMLLSQAEAVIADRRRSESARSSGRAA
ncbi:MAG: response regulator [Phycisphaerae bacterium]|nr:response regulator [Phycisphaerae bacterium]